jgi:hypothetical protein
MVEALFRGTSVVEPAGAALVRTFHPPPRYGNA